MSKNNTSFIINDVIKDLVDAEKSLVNPLLKLNYFGILIKNEELINYTSNEINGYKEEGLEVPEYRKTLGTLLIDARAYLTEHSNLELPISMLESPFKEALQYLDVREGISAIENMGKEIIEMNGDKKEFYRPVPMEMLHILQPALRQLYKTNVSLNAVSAKIKGNSNIILEIPNSIRTRLLKLVMMIGEKFGYEIEITSFNEQRDENNKTILNFMNTNITTSGDGNIINTGNEVEIDAKIIINKGNKEDLAKYLQDNGISEEDTSELIEIIDTEEPNAETKKFGEKVSDWTKKMIGKAVDGSWNIGIGAAGSLIAQAIGKYYGIM